MKELSNIPNNWLYQSVQCDCTGFSLQRISFHLFGFYIKLTWITQNIPNAPI